MDGVVKRAGVEGVVEMLDKSIGALRGNLLIIVSAKEGATIDRIEFVENIVDADKVIRRFLVSGGDDVQPGYVEGEY